MIEKARRKELFEEIEHFYKYQGGMPEEMTEDIMSICPEDSYDGLDIVVGRFCSPEYGGSGEARSFLSMIGATEEEIDELIQDNIDMYF